VGGGLALAMAAALRLGFGDWGDLLLVVVEEVEGGGGPAAGWR
jgi:hypothetical protein